MTTINGVFSSSLSHICTEKFRLTSRGGWMEGLVCADPSAMTYLGMSWIYFPCLLGRGKSSHCCFCSLVQLYFTQILSYILLSFDQFLTTFLAKFHFLIKMAARAYVLGSCVERMVQSIMYTQQCTWKSLGPTSAPMNLCVQMIMIMIKCFEICSYYNLFQTKMSENDMPAGNVVLNEHCKQLR